MEYAINIQGAMVYVEVTRFYGGRAAKVWGRPEDCYPEEPAEIEFDVLAVEVEEDDGEITTYKGRAAEDYACEQYGDDLCDQVYAEHVAYLRKKAGDY